MKKISLLLGFILFFHIGFSQIIVEPSISAGQTSEQAENASNVALYLNSMADAQPYFGAGGLGGLEVQVNGAICFVEIEANGGGDIGWMADGTWVTLNCTSNTGTDGKAYVELIQGDANNIADQMVYAYVDDKDGIVKVTTSLVDPVGTFLSLAFIGIQDYTNVALYGAHKFQRTTEAFSHGGWGSFSRTRYQDRRGTGHRSGSDPTFAITTNAGSRDIVDFAITEGTYIQMNIQHMTDLMASVDGMFISLEGSTRNLDYITSIGAITADEDEVSYLDNDYCIFHVWGNCNISDEQSKMYVTPGRKFTDVDLAIRNAEDGNFPKLPKWSKGVNFPIATLVLKYNTANSGTWTNAYSTTSYGWSTVATDGTFKSINYPDLYDHGLNTGYTYIAPVGTTKIKANFASPFNVENSPYDFVYVGAVMPADNGANANFTYNGNLSPFTSGEIQGRYFYIKFHTDGSVSYAGWRISSWNIYGPTSVPSSYLINNL